MKKIRKIFMMVLLLGLVATMFAGCSFVNGTYSNTVLGVETTITISGGEYEMTTGSLLSVTTTGTVERDGDTLTFTETNTGIEATYTIQDDGSLKSSLGIIYEKQ